MEIIQQLFQYLLHIDTYLVSFVATYGIWTYVVLFLIIFCETGLVVTPFLPGDSLLFAAGSIAANDNSGLNIQLLFMLLCVASMLGNKLNYTIGRIVGPRVFTAKDSWLLNKRHLEEAHRFYEKHGGKTIIIARFLPIIRTFVPFIAGIGAMSLRRFSFYNIVSGILWIGSLVGAGYYFGSLPIIKENFTLVIYAIVGISVLPALYTLTMRKIG
jgi:membrane-associated protein